MQLAKSSKYTIDATQGPILPKLLRFILPLALSSVLQLFYNAADVVVVGRFAGSQSLAAVGSNSSLINLLINLVIGLSVGASVLTAQYYGAHDDENVSASVHTAMMLSVIGGLTVGLIGFTFCRRLLQLMQSPEDVIDLGTLYLRIYFCGMPAQMVYNFGAGVLRAVGDTRRPLYILSISGLVNVCLNLIFVIVFHMDVAGVALATITSQFISAALVVRCLMHADASFRLYPKRLRIERDKFLKVLRIGLPAGLQGIVFSLSNILIQASVNWFGSQVMAGSAAATSIEGFVYVAQNAVYQGALTFSGQNIGAKRYDRIHRITLTCVLTVTVLGFALGAASVIFGHQLLRIYNTDPQVIEYGMIRLRMFGYAYFMCGVMKVFGAMMRGMGRSFVPMVVSLMGACVFRIIWIYTIFQKFHTLNILFVSYPISWVLTAAVQFVCYLVVYRQVVRKSQQQTAA